MCRRNSPSVIDSRPTPSWSLIASRIASSSAARSASPDSSWRAPSSFGGRSLRAREVLPLQVRPVEVVGEVVGERLVLRHRPDQLEELRLRREHEPRPRVEPEQVRKPPLVDTPAERIVERPPGEDLLAELPRPERRRVRTLADDRVDDAVRVPQRYRHSAAVEPRERLAHGPGHGALKEARRAREPERRAVDALEQRGAEPLEPVEDERLVRLRVVLPRRSRERLEIPAGDALEEERRRVALERLDRQLEDLPASRHDAEGDGDRISIGDAGPESCGQHALRAVGSPAGDAREEVAEAAASRRDDDELVPLAETIDLVDADRPGDDPSAALLEVLEQPGKVEAVVDREARCGEVTREREGLRALDVVVVAAVRRPAPVPVVDAERALASPRAVVVRDGVRQPAGADLLRRPLGVERRLHAVLL